MTALNYCRSCTGPRPRAARRCPWCHKSYADTPSKPEHLFATFNSEPSPRTNNVESK